MELLSTTSADKQLPTDEFTAPCSSTADSDDTGPPVLKKFRFIVSKLRTAQALATTAPDSPGDVKKYIQEVEGLGCGGCQASEALEFWQQRKAIYSRLSPIAEDLVAAPASEAFVERIFSVAGMLSTGRRNRMRQSRITILCHRAKLYKNSSGDEIANVNFHAVRPEATRIR